MLGGDEHSAIRSGGHPDDTVGPRIVDLPIETALRIFTLSADNLLVGAAKCASICPMWWLALRETTACGHGLLDRAKVLGKIGRALGRDELYHDGHVQLSGVMLGDAGAKVLGAGLSALPVARTALFSGPQVLDLCQCDVSPAGMMMIAEAMVWKSLCCPRVVLRSLTVPWKIYVTLAGTLANCCRIRPAAGGSESEL